MFWSKVALNRSYLALLKSFLRDANLNREVEWGLNRISRFGPFWNFNLGISKRLKQCKLTFLDSTKEVTDESMWRQSGKARRSKLTALLKTANCMLAAIVNTYFSTILCIEFSKNGQAKSWPYCTFDGLQWMKENEYHSNLGINFLFFTAFWVGALKLEKDYAVY